MALAREWPVCKRHQTRAVDGRLYSPIGVFTSPPSNGRAFLFGGLAVAYLDSSEFKTRLGITGSTYDSVIAGILAGVEANINSYLGFNPSDSSFTHYLDTRQTYGVTLKRWPVTDVTSVYLDPNGYYGQAPDAFAATTLLTEGVDYMVSYDQGSRVCTLIRVGRQWPWTFNVEGFNSLTALPGVCPGCLKVEYTIDNGPVLAAAEQAGYLEAATRYKAAIGLGAGVGFVTSDGMDGASVSIAPYQTSKRNDSSDGFQNPATAGYLMGFRIGRMV